MSCILCGEELGGMGNNPWPLAVEGRCCDACNRRVVMARMMRAVNRIERRRDDE